MTELGSGLIGTAASLATGAAPWPMLMSVAAVVVYALLSDRPKNDDDDSSPGGGLMQPVA